MTTFIVTALATGTEVYRYQADSPIEWAGMEFSTHSHLPEQVAPVEQPRPVQRWDEVDFLRRFTSAERLEIRESAVTDVVLRDFIELLRAAGVARNDDPDVHRALGYLTQAGVLSAGRAEEILYG